MVKDVLHNSERQAGAADRPRPQMHAAREGYAEHPELRCTPSSAGKATITNRYVLLRMTVMNAVHDDQYDDLLICGCGAF